MIRIILPEEYQETAKEMERLYYESTTKERILGIALANGSTNTVLMDTYYTDYLNTFVEYTQLKDKFYLDCVTKYMKEYPQAVSWELEFTSGTLVLHD